jgi:hypothetical protein
MQKKNTFINVYIPPCDLSSTQTAASTDICDVKLLLSPMELLLSPMVQYKHVVATLLFEEIISWKNNLKLR